MSAREHYEVDPFNRLVFVKKFRQVVSGRFIAGPRNSLAYEFNKSQGVETPQKIEFSGDYSLDKDHNLVFTLNKWNNQCEGNRLTLKTRLMDAGSNDISFLINSRLDENKTMVYVLKLSGSWKADEHNRLTFGVQRDSKKPDTLVLTGAWELNDNNELTYRHSPDAQALTFKGRWDIKKKGRLSYILDKKLGAGLNFKASLGTLAPKGKDQYVTFDIGIGVSRSKKTHRKVVFAGTWKIGKGKKVFFETSPAGEKGAKLKFFKDLFDKKGLAYLEASLKDKERFIGGGIAFKW